MLEQSEGLSLRGVRKSYGAVEVVKGVDLEINRGEFVVILGPSGCGKSTLLRMIAGLDDVTAGHILVEGRDMTHLPPRKRECAMVFQSYALYPHLTVAGNIGYPLRIAGTAKAERQARVAEAARAVGLEALLDRKPSQLSGGQRQRVAMGRAIIRHPKLFLFDEPLSNLDAKLRVQMRAEIRGLHNRLGVTSIFVTHDQVEAMTLADRIVVMNVGHVEQIGVPTEIYARPASRYVASFVGAQPMSFLDGLISQDGQTAQVGNGCLRLTAPTAPAWRGKRVTIGFRAENVTVAPPGASADFKGDLFFSEQLGPFAIHHVTVGEATMLAQGPGGHAPPAGSVGLTADPAHVHLFDPETGRRIETNT
jgi:sn-glycerol 3-phosphate transport system ATP-binding protein